MQDNISRLLSQMSGIMAVAIAVGLWMVHLTRTNEWQHPDFFAPDWIFVSVYLLSSFGQVVLVTLGREVGLVHLYLPALSTYLFVVLGGFVGLLFGLTLSARFGEKVVAERGDRDPQSHIIMTRMYSISLVVLTLGVLSNLIGSVWGGRWSGIYGVSQYEYGLAYYLQLGAQLVVSPALIMAAYTGIRLKRFPLWLFVMVPYFIAALGSTARGTMIPLTLLILIAWNFARDRLQGYTLIGWAAVIAVMIVILGAARNSGNLGLLSVLRGGIANAGESDWFDVIMTDVGVPATITTNVIRWFPDMVNWLYGQSYVTAVLNLIPGFFFGGSINRPFLTMAFLFKDLLEEGSFNPDIGYGFSLLAESYANFGLIGSVLVMFVVGLILRHLYQRINDQVGPMRAVAVAVFGVTTVAAIMSLRGEWLSFIKPTFYGIVTSMTLWWLAAHGTRGFNSIMKPNDDVFDGIMEHD